MSNMLRIKGGARGASREGAALRENALLRENAALREELSVQNFELKKPRTQNFELRTQNFKLLTQFVECRCGGGGLSGQFNLPK